jgi:hypothetical protein
LQLTGLEEISLVRTDFLECWTQVIDERLLPRTDTCCK